MKKYLQFHRLVALLVVAVPLAIAGCGGGSSTTPEPMPEPTAVERAMSQYDMAKADYDGLADSATVDQRLAAAQALDTAADALVAATSASGTGAELAAAQAAAAASQSLLDMAQAAKAAADMAADDAAKDAAAQFAYDSAKSVYDTLPDNATDAQRLEAATALRDAAQDLEDRLTETGAAQDAIDAAMANTMAAQMKVDAAQNLLDLAAARVTARSDYDAAKMAYNDLGIDATVEARLAAAKVLDEAAKALVVAITADPSSPAMDLASAQAMASEAASVLMMAQAAKDDADRMASEAEALRGLRMDHADAVAAYNALAEDASDEARLAAAKEIKVAADAVVAELLTQDASASAVDTARMAVTDAQAKVNTYQAKVDAANQIIRTQMAAITTAQTALTSALAEIDADNPTAAQITAADTARMGLQAAVDGGADLTDEQKSAANAALNSSDVTIAKAQLMMYTAAASADGATDEAKLAAYEGKLKAATRLLSASAASSDDREEASRIIGSATTMIASLKADIQAAKDAEANAKRLASNAESMQVAKAINAHGVGADDDPPAEFMSPTAELTGTGDTNFGISRTSGAAKIALTQTAADAKNKPFSTGTAPSVEYYPGTTFSRSGMSGKRPFTEMAAVYTDIEEAGDDDWAPESFVTGGTGITVNPNGSVVMGAAVSIAATHLGGAVLPSTPTDPDDATERNIAANNRLGGTFFGVSGHFSCGTFACTVTRTSTGVSASAELTFTPTTGTTATLKAKYADPDTDYTYFGYWMKSTTQRDETMVHDIETFSGGGNSTALALGDLTTETVFGTAKYYGAAAGVYVKKDGAGDSLVVTDGTFTADAMLTARFGGTAIADADKYEVQGTISDFMDGSTDLGFADLTLRGPDGNAGASFNPTGAITGGETDGGGTSGRWSGQFYGNTGLNADGTDRDPDGDGPLAAVVDNFPSDVAGEFNGHFENGHVAGAFGAEFDQ